MMHTHSLSKKYYLIIFIILICLLRLHAQSPQQFFRQGMQAFTTANYPQAVKKFTKLRSAFPYYIKSDQAAFYLAEAYFNLKNYTACINTLRTFPRQFPVSPLKNQTAYHIGLAYYHLKRYDIAIDYFIQQTLVSGKEFYSAALYHHALSLLALSNEARAREVFLQLAALDDSDPLIARSLYYLGSTAFTRGNYTEAAPFFEKIYTAYPSSPFLHDAIFYLAEAWGLSGDTAQALPLFENFLKLFPDTAYRETALFRISSFYFNREDYQTAINYSLLYENEFPGGRYSPALKRMKPTALFKIHKFNEAAFAYQELLETASAAEKQTLCYNLGLACTNAGLYNEAAAWFKQAINGSNSSITGNSLLKSAEIYRELRENSKAAEALELYRAQNTDTPRTEEIMRALALYYSQLYQTDAALKIWNDLIKNYPNSPNRDEYIFRRALAYIFINKNKEALADLNALISLFPFSSYYAEAYYNIGYIYSLQYEYVRAFEYYEAILKLFQAGELRERTLLAMGVNYYNLDDYEQAVILLLGLLTTAEHTKWKRMALDCLGKSYTRLGKAEEAARCFAQAAQIQPAP